MRSRRPASPAPGKARCRYVTSERLISRTHFARFLVEAGHARDVKDVFKRYLAPGTPGYVEHAWATLPEAIGWIHAPGGDAVLAHPGRYKVDARRAAQLLGEFRDAGGDAIEVLSPSHTSAQVTQFASLARMHGLRGVDGLRLSRAGRELARPRRPAAAAGRRHARMDELVSAVAGTAGRSRIAAPSSSSPTAPASPPRCSATACWCSSTSSSSTASRSRSSTATRRSRT